MSKISVLDSKTLVQLQRKKIEEKLRKKKENAISSSNDKLKHLRKRKLRLRSKEPRKSSRGEKRTKEEKKKKKKKEERMKRDNNMQKMNKEDLRLNDRQQMNREELKMSVGHAKNRPKNREGKKTSRED